jgi:hypothetical protein
MPEIFVRPAASFLWVAVIVLLIIILAAWFLSAFERLDERSVVDGAVSMAQCRELALHLS